MTALKGRDIDRFVSKPDIETGVVLVYGPDAGLVLENADRIATALAGTDPDPMALTRLDFAEISGDPGRIATEADTPPLFGGKRVLRIANATNAAAKVLAGLANAGTDAAIVVTAGTLAPRDALRRDLEAEKAARVVPCYADTDRSLDQLIATTFTEAGIAADRDAITRLSEILGNDRGITRSELEKLVLYAADSKTISRDDVETLCGDNGTIAFDAILDATGTGSLDRLDQALIRAFDSGLYPAAILTAAQNHFSNLRQMRAGFESGEGADQIVRKNRVHFSRGADMQAQIRRWDDRSLSEAGERLHAAIARTRHQPDLAEAITRQALLSIGSAAARL